MAKVSVKVKLDTAMKNLMSAFVIDEKLGGEVGTLVIKGVKESVAVGKSSVKGFGRFAAYATQRDKDPKAYPISVLKEYPGKNVRPVNLKLSGEMLDALKFKVDDGAISIGFADAEGKIKKMFDAHNHGTLVHKNVPMRKFLPTAKGEEFSIALTKAIKDIFIKRISDIIKRMNNK